MSDPAESPGGAASLRRACDQCRSRKIRCDKETPCSNCRTAQRECSSTGLGQKPKEARQRVLISHQYERKIDHFEARLAGIEDMLRSLTTSLSRGEASAPAPAPATTGNSGNTTHTYNTPSVAESSTVYDEPSADEDNDQEFEGYSSMTAHTAFASEFLEQAVTSTSLGHRLKPDIQNALATLQQMVHIQDRKRSWQESRFVHQKPVPKGGINQLPMPPTPVVVGLLREMKDQKPATFMLNCAFIAVEDFIESCRKVYFATEDFSHAIFIIVNAGLYYLFQEKAVTNEAMSEEYLRCHYICRDNLETALATLPLLMPAKMEMVEGLLLGATYAVDISKFTIAWQLSNAAAAMCQTLGWHRLPVTEEESNDKKSAIFWFSYMLDKGLALRFGRSSVIQDWDISVPRRFGNIKVASPWKTVLNIWVRMAAMMGETYEQLYSPGALARSPEERTEIGRLLIEKMKHLKKQTHELEADILREEKENMQGDELKDKEWRMMTLEMVVKSDEVSNWALLTLLYRAIPGTGGSSGTFNEECVEAARMACKCHQECMELTSNSVFVMAGYVHWTILYMPFIPFIILFCHAIETSNMDDVQRLGQFIVTLQPVIGISESIEKLHRLCQVLYKIATLYIEAKAQQQKDNDMTMVNNDFDMYLSQLGIITQHSPLDGTGGDDQNTAAINPARLGDWFSGNRNILGLMEEDLSDFNPGVWSSVLGP